MTMFDKVGVGTDWIEIKRQKDKAVHDNNVTVAKKLLAKGLSPQDIAESVDLPIEEIKALIKHN